MSQDFLQGAAAERAVIAAWLRKRTNLKMLAQLIEADVCSMPVTEQNEYAERNRIGKLR